MKKTNIFLFLFLFFCIGCTQTQLLLNPMTIGATKWSNGLGVKYYNEDYNIVYRSAKLSLKDLGFNIIKDQKGKNQNYIVAGDKDRFKITLRNVKDNISEVKIRINFWGDKPYADLIFQKIDSNMLVIEFDQKGMPVKQN